MNEKAIRKLIAFLFGRELKREGSKTYLVIKSELFSYNVLKLKGVVRLQPGRLIYRQTLRQGEEFSVWGLTIFLLVLTIGHSLSQGAILWVGVFLSVFAIVFCLMKTLWKKENYPAFYEHGVVLYRLGTPQDFLPYDVFEVFFVDFYYEECGDDFRTRFYSIAFVQQGKVVAYLRSEHLNEFQAVWQQLILLHPELNDRLYPMDERNRKHHQLCDELKGYY